MGDSDIMVQVQAFACHTGGVGVLRV
jgi:hypothetical protein